MSVGLWTLLIVVAALGVSTSAQWRRNGGSVITVYTDINFRGQSASFRDDTPSLVPYGLNDKVSSIQIPNGEAWEVCQDANYANRCQVLSGSVADLRTMGWNDRISSLRRINDGGFGDRRSNGGFGDRRSNGEYGNRQGGVYAPNSQQGLLFYDRSGYRGSSRLVTGGASNLGFSARQGSVQVRGGGPWELCDNSGRCATINEDISDMSQLGLNGRIVSARVVNGYQPYGSDRRDRRDNRYPYYGR